MKGEALRTAIRALLESHPNVEPSKAGHVAHAERYRAADGANIGLETRGEGHQNIFVEARAVRVSRLADIRHKEYAAADFRVSKPSHDLFHAEAFSNADIVRFAVTNLWQAVRVVHEVAGAVARR